MNLDWIIPVGIIGIIVYGVYSLFELFVRRQERLMIIDKMMSGAADTDGMPKNVDFSLGFMKNRSSVALRCGGLLLGLGLGIIVGYMLGNWLFPQVEILNMIASSGDITPLLAQQMRARDADLTAVYSASVMAFGGLGLICAFIVERRITAKDQRQKN